MVRNTWGLLKRRRRTELLRSICFAGGIDPDKRKLFFRITKGEKALGKKEQKILSARLQFGEKRKVDEDRFHQWGTVLKCATPENQEEKRKKASRHGQRRRFERCGERKQSAMKNARKIISRMGNK